MLRIAKLRPFPKTEQRLFAVGLPSGSGDGDDLFGRHGVGPGVRDVAGENAVTTLVSAQIRERQENLAGVGDCSAGAGLTQLASRFEERVEFGAGRFQQRFGFHSADRA